MSQFGLPDSNDNVFEKRIEWDSISSWFGSSIVHTRNEAHEYIEPGRIANALLATEPSRLAKHYYLLELVG